ncbi:MAG: hypothetical protein IPK60_12175 [Sandaracinaceae bacterium]|nr:hypothetical protein [Sandaracinaceae bacterium]
MTRRTRYTWSGCAILLAIAGCSSANEMATDAGPLGDLGTVSDSGSGTDAASDAGGGPADANVNSDGGLAPARIYATIVTHNEIDSKPECVPINANTGGAWNSNRALTKMFVDTIVAHGGAYDLGSDTAYIDAMADFETADERATTGGMNILQYVSSVDPEHIVVDAHHHPVPTLNYGDLQYMLHDASVSDTHVVSGLIWSPTADADWEQFRMTVNAIGHTYAWDAQILWGAATVGHAGPDSQASGVWRPTNAAMFHTDDSAQSLVYVGGYKEQHWAEYHGSGLNDLLSKLASGELEPNHMYTAAVMFDHCSFAASDITDVAALLDSHASDVAAGRLVWATVPEIVSIWRSEYASDGHVYNATSDVSECSPACGVDMICCAAPAPCAGTCVNDCRVAGCMGTTVCDESTGMCAPTMHL